MDDTPEHVQSDGESELTRLRSPSEVAAHLQITSAMVRRYGDALERVSGQVLPRVNQARAFNETQLTQLKQAREMVSAGFGNLSIEQALRRVMGLELPQLLNPGATPIDEGVALQVRQEVQTLLEMMTRVEAQNAAVLERLNGQIPQLEAQTDTTTRLESLERQNAELLEVVKRLESRVSSEIERPVGWFARVFGQKR
jgi:DNA-binding transcriptional MerR regulator